MDPWDVLPSFLDGKLMRCIDESVCAVPGESHAGGAGQPDPGG